MTSTQPLTPVGPIQTVHFFADLHTDLVALLRALTDAEWQKPTICAGWSVQDVAAHILGGDVGKVSARRDGHRSPPPPFPLDTPAALLRFIDQNNAEFVRALRRASPRILLEWIDSIGREVAPLFAQLDPDAPSAIAVSWAGEAVSANWFDIAREFTERWHHQQHIRDAVGRPDLNPRYLAPVLDTFMRALPYTYRDIHAPDGIALLVTVTGAAGGHWTLRREDQTWRLYHGADGGAQAQVVTNSDTAWRLLTKGLTAEQARTRVQIQGDTALAAHFFAMVSIIA